jgi:uncharacterized protein (TIGR02145 family)
MKRFLLIPLVLSVLSYTLATDRDICEISVENQDGWNLVGLPVYVSDDNYQSVFPGSIENTLFSFSDGTYTSEDELILGEGYWLRFSEDQSDTLIGECIDGFTVSLLEGWNLISVVSHPVSVDDIIDTDGIIVDGTVFGFSGGYYEPVVLEPGKGYWVRCYNDGEIIIPETTVTDIDGNVYETVEVGEQVWMKENLKVTHYNDGSEIPTGYSNSEWADLDETETGAYAVHDDNESNADTYGYLYNWYAVDDSRGVCPEDWHIPTDEEYTALSDYLGGESVAGGKMKECTPGSCPDSDYWPPPNTGATNESGFTGLPGGFRNTNNGYYGNMGIYGYFWSSTENYNYSAWNRLLNYNYSDIVRYYYNKRNGFSVRCIRD